MIKVGTTDVEKIKVGSDFAYIVKVGDTTAWTTPVTLHIDCVEGKAGVDPNWMARWLTGGVSSQPNISDWLTVQSAVTGETVTASKITWDKHYDEGYVSCTIGYADRIIFNDERVGKSKYKLAADSKTYGDQTYSLIGSDGFLLMLGSSFISHNNGYPEFRIKVQFYDATDEEEFIYEVDDYPGNGRLDITTGGSTGI